MNWLGELIFGAIVLGAFLLWGFSSQDKTYCGNKASRARVDYSRIDRHSDIQGDPSDSIAIELIQTWARLETQYPSDTLRSISRETGIPFKTLYFARRVRNEVAHRGEDVPCDRLLGAIRILRRAERRIGY